MSGQLRPHGRAVGIASGVVAPAVLAVTTVTLTVVDRDFLASAGWSAVRRTSVGWPSILMLGPRGAVMQVAFLASGLLALVFVASAARLACRAEQRVSLAAVAVMGLALCLLIARPDSSALTAVTTWHGALHDAAYPFIPMAGLVGALGLAIGSAPAGPWRRMRVASLVALALIGPAFALTFLDPVAQLARYFLFAPLLAWSAALAMTFLRVLSARQVRTGVDEPAE